MATTHRGSRHSSTIAKIITLTGRNVRLYFIDRTSVFFSLLGAVIAILIVTLFMKNDIVNTMTTSYQGLVTRESASRLMDTWLVASACVIASATTGLGAMRSTPATGSPSDGGTSSSPLSAPGLSPSATSRRHSSSRRS